MRLLIVEDDKDQVQMYHDVIESYNRQQGCAITPITKNDLKEAKLALLNPEFDAAVIDLKLDNGSNELQGIELIKSIQDKLRFPVFVVSGSIAQIDDIEESTFFKKRLRDGDFKTVLAEAYGIFQTGITHILGSKGIIENHLNAIFWKHLSNSMNVWINDENRSPEQKQKTLLRYTLLHIQEYLELTEESDFENYHSGEIYITPPIKKRVFTGDIVVNKNDGLSYIVLTPSCDLAQSKAKDILLALIENEDSGIILEKTNIIKKGNSDEKILLDATNNLKALINNSFSNKYHFLPGYKEIKAGLINFQKINSIRVKDFNDNFIIIASVNSSFTKDIVARFSYYYSRQGSPDFDVEEIYKSITSN